MFTKGQRFRSCCQHAGLLAHSVQFSQQFLHVQPLVKTQIDAFEMVKYLAAFTENKLNLSDEYACYKFCVKARLT